MVNHRRVESLSLQSSHSLNREDLRAFGVAPRTWLHKLSYGRRDRILIAVSVTVFLLSTVLSILGWGKFWVPGWLLRMART